MEKTNELKKLLLYIFIVIIIFGLFYGLTILLTKNKKQNYNDEDYKLDTNIDYEKIMIGNMYNQKEEEYYVLVEMVDDDSITSYESSRAEYVSKENSLKVYIADLSSAFNKSYIADDSNIPLNENIYPKFNDSALLKINGNVITESYEGKDQILEQFNNIKEEQD